jgi:hypothetical protein
MDIGKSRVMPQNSTSVTLCRRSQTNGQWILLVEHSPSPARLFWTLLVERAFLRGRRRV